MLSPTDAKALAFNEGAEYQLPLKRKKKNTVNNLITFSYKTTLDLFTIQSHVFLLNLRYRYVSFFFIFLCLLVGGKGRHHFESLGDTSLELGQDARDAAETRATRREAHWKQL